MRTVLVTLIVCPWRAVAGAVIAVTVRSGCGRESNVRTNVWPLASVPRASIHATVGTAARSSAIEGTKSWACVPEMPVPVAEPVPISTQPPPSQARTKIDDAAPAPRPHVTNGPPGPSVSDASLAVGEVSTSPSPTPPKPVQTVPLQRRT